MLEELLPRAGSIALVDFDEHLDDVQKDWLSGAAVEAAL